MRCIHNKIVKVTEHYGYRIELNVFGYDRLYVLYRVSDTRHANPITARIKRSEAIKECKYLEKLNAPKFSKEKEND